MMRVVFQIVERKQHGTRIIAVQSSLENIRRSQGGEEVLLAIAANALRLVAQRDGLERALERFSDFVLDKTRTET